MLLPPAGSPGNSMANIALAVNQHAQGVTGDQSSPWAHAAATPNAVLQVGQTWTHSVGATADSWKAIFSPPPGAPAPSAGQKTVMVIRAVQQTAAALMGGLGLVKQALDVGFAGLTAPLAALYPSLPSATLTSLYVGTPHAHITHPPSGPPPVPPTPMPSIGISLLGNSVRVLINNMPVARAEDIGLAPTCCGLPPAWFRVKTGSSNVFMGGNRAARMGDICKACSLPSPPLAGVAKFLAFAGVAVGALGIAADVGEAAVADSDAMASAKALSAAMASAQMAMDAAKMAAEATMWKDPAVPPTGSLGAFVDPSHATVLIGGFPMINIPDPVTMLLDRLVRYMARGGGGNPQGTPSCPA